MLSEYVTIMVCHGKSLDQVVADLDAFLGRAGATRRPRRRGALTCHVWSLKLKPLN